MSAKSYEEMQVEKSQKLAMYRQKMMLIAFIAEKPVTKRSSHETRQMEDALIVIRENYQEFFELTTEFEFGAILFEARDGVTDDINKNEWFSHLGSLLMESRLRPPRFPNPVLPHDLEKIMIEIYHAQIEISGVLEEIEPVYAKWKEYRKRTESMWSAICNFDDQWKATATFEHLVSQEVSNFMKKMGEYVAAYKIRFTMLEKSHEVASRLITLQQGTPIEAHRRTEGQATRAYTPSAPSGPTAFKSGVRGFGKR